MDNLNINIVGLATDGSVDMENSFISDEMYIFRNTSASGPARLESGNPYRVEEGRVLMVNRGSVDMYFNLEERHLTEHSVVVLLPDGIFEIKSYSENYNMQVFSFKDLPILTSFNKAFILQLDDDKWNLANEYFNLIWHEAHQQPMLIDAVRHLQTALLLELKRWDDNEQVILKNSTTRQQTIFHNFLELVTKDGLAHRKIDYYAETLCITPNYLSDVVKQESGMTVMQWINRHAIQEIKVLLKYSNLSISEIAEKVNFDNPSFFSKFFKRETGLTPNEYRNKK